MIYHYLYMVLVNKISDILILISDVLNKVKDVLNELSYFIK